MTEGTRILVVDDNEEFCQNLKDIAELEGYEVQTAYSGFQAIDLVARDIYSVVLMDVRMPRIGGIKTLQKMKLIRPDMPVIMVTAYETEHLVIEGLRAGAFGFLKKPMDLGRMFDVIENALFLGPLVLLIGEREGINNRLEEMISSQAVILEMASDWCTARTKAFETAYDVMILNMRQQESEYPSMCRTLLDTRTNSVSVVAIGCRHKLKRELMGYCNQTEFIWCNKQLETDKLATLLGRVRANKSR
jgi:DNA-binding NtrC family response regulator